VSEYGAAIFPHHAEILAASAIDPAVAAERGYVSVDTKARLESAGFVRSQRIAPGLLIPIYGTDGELRLHQYRPDNPRLEGKTSKPRKYETPWRHPICLDVPRRILGQLRDAGIPLWITEGSRKADAAVSAGACCIALIGVDGWMRDGQALPDWRDVTLKGRVVLIAFDSDVMTKKSVAGALDRLTAWLQYRGAEIRHVLLPQGDATAKTGLDDYLAAGGTLAGLMASASAAAAVIAAEVQERLPPAPVFGAPRDSHTPSDISGPLLDAARQAYTHWLGSKYDLGALDCVLAAAAAAKLDGDPPWMLMVGGSGAAKTETVTALAGAGAVLVSTISGEAALLSGTSSKERASDASGGLLRYVGSRGVLVIKDFTSILSMNRDTRALVLAALREIYDGHWTRNVGTEGGKTLAWRGRLVLIGASTTAWDSAHQVVATMGDRFLLVRLNSAEHRHAAGLQAMRNVSSEAQMRAELADVVGNLMSAVEPKAAITLDDDEIEELLGLADIVTRIRTAVERDYKGEPAFAHDLEMPTRLAKQLVQLARGAIALGMDRGSALAVAERAARDTMPPLRRRALLDVYEHPGSFTGDVVTRLQVPRKTVDRTLQELHLLGLLVVGDVPYGERVRWQYTLTDDIDLLSLKRLAGNVSTPMADTQGKHRRQTGWPPGSIGEEVNQ
jgi:hypothetical protein